MRTRIIDVHRVYSSTSPKQAFLRQSTSHIAMSTAVYAPSDSLHPAGVQSCTRVSRHGTSYFCSEHYARERLWPCRWTHPFGQRSSSAFPASCNSVHALIDQGVRDCNKIRLSVSGDRITIFHENSVSICDRVFASSLSLQGCHGIGDQCLSGRPFAPQ